VSPSCAWVMAEEMKSLTRTVAAWEAKTDMVSVIHPNAFMHVYRVREKGSAGMPRTPHASRGTTRAEVREAFGVRRIPPLLMTALINSPMPARDFRQAAPGW